MSENQNSHDRNLIFGIVAFHLDFITKDQLITAMQAWLLDKSMSLGDVLVSQKVLSASRKQLLSSLVDEHIQQHGNDVAKSMQTFHGLSPLREELQSMGDPEIYRAASMMPAGEELDVGMGLMTMPHAADRKERPESRFSLIRRYAEGGLGVVWVALDSELVREVALKEIKPQYADHGNSRARFLQEAEITGRLEHPGIVPVYGLGKYSDGRPYYAMRMIKGESLQEAINEFHGKSDSASQNSLALRELLQQLIDVCNAIEYAHSRGILHRDLKPDNVMLGKYGETLVVDWGLAKAIGDADHQTRSDETVILPELGTDSVPTKMGEVVGTIAYMSPEQAAGKHRELGPASDVFSLGAMLYSVIAGVACQRNGTVGQLLRCVQEGKFPRPREVKPTASPALEAICLKAMARYPEDRYGSAAALAADIERFLADEPVAAYREPLLPRLRRWARSHPRTVTSAVGGTILAIAFSTFIVILQNGYNHQLSAKNEALELETQRSNSYNQQLTAKNDALEKEKKRSENAFDFLVKVLASPDPSISGKDVKVFDILEPALEQSLSDKYWVDDPLGQAKLLHAFGQSFGGLGYYEEAIRAEEAALHIRTTELGEKHPDTLDCMNNLAAAYQHAGQMSKALPMFEDAFATTLEVRGEEHEDTLNSLFNLAGAYFKGRQYDQAIPRYQALEEMFRETFGPSDKRTLIVMASLSACYRELGRYEEALALSKSAYQQLNTRLRPNHPETLQAMINYAWQLRDVGQTEVAIELIKSRLAVTDDGMPQDHPDRLNASNILASCYESTEQYESAIDELQRTLKVCLDNRSLGSNHFLTRRTRRLLANCYLQWKRPVEAESVVRDWINAASAMSDFRDLSVGQTYLAIALLDQGKSAESAESAESAQLFFSEKEPKSNEHVWTQLTLALALMKQNRVDEARPLLREGYQQIETRVGAMSREAVDRLAAIARRISADKTIRDDPPERQKWLDLLDRLQSSLPLVPAG